VEPIDVPLLAITDEHASGQAALPTPGEWEFRFTLRTTEIDQETVSVSVPIA
jgi:copper transport protein